MVSMFSAERLSTRAAAFGRVLIGLVPVFGFAAVAQAQDVPDALYSAQEDRNDPDSAEVFSLPDAERYRAVGIRMGSGTLYPDVELVGLVNSNVPAIRGGEGDVGARIAPRLRFQNRNPLSELKAYAQASLTQYADSSPDNVEEFGAGASYRRNFGATHFFRIHAEGGSFVEDRASSFTPQGLLKPTEYDRGTAGVALALGLGRVTLSPWVDVDRQDFRDSRLQAAPATLVDQDSRDQTITRGGFSAGVSSGAGTFFYAGTELNRRNYDEDFPSDRDSKGMAIFGGVRIQPSRLTRFDVAIGYQKQRYALPFLDPKGLYFNASFDWKPTPLLLLRVDARRDISETGGLLLGGSMRTRVRALASYELRRNLRIDGSMQYRKVSTKTVFGSDQRGLARLDVRYLANPGLEIVGGADALISRNAGGPFNDYGRVRVYAGIRFKI